MTSPVSKESLGNDRHTEAVLEKAGGGEEGGCGPWGGGGGAGDGTVLSVSLSLCVCVSLSLLLYPKYMCMCSISRISSSWARAGCKKTLCLLHYPRKI